MTHAGKRHLIFATNDQLELMKTAVRWYIDGTYKVVRKPFEMQLYIHAFVRRGDCSKQIPLVFVFMTGKSKSDYIKVLQI